MNKLITIAGPTASGKTALALRLAARCNGEIIGADSMQIYQKIQIGTAKPTKEETGAIPYHMVDYVSPRQFYTVSQFKDDALTVIADVIARKRPPIICGGTGLYVNALLYEMDFTQGDYDQDYRTKLATHSLEELTEQLKNVDPQSFATIDLQNRRRVERALEIHHLTGLSKSKQVGNYMEHPRPFDHRVFLVDMDRQLLYSRINRRVDRMVEQGLVEEVRQLRAECRDDGLPVFQFIGYKEILAFLEGKMPLEQAIEEIKKNTRHFAKRQLTWFKKLSGLPVWWIPYNEDIDKMIAEIEEKINE